MGDSPCAFSLSADRRTLVSLRRQVQPRRNNGYAYIFCAFRCKKCMSKRILLDKLRFLCYNIPIPCFIFIVAFQFFGIFVFNKRLKFIIITPLLDNKNVEYKLCNLPLFEGAYLVSLMGITLSGGYLILENLNSLNLSALSLLFNECMPQHE